jgi:glycosyltransferase involved in cell wall biosynthesis
MASEATVIEKDAAEQMPDLLLWPTGSIASGVPMAAPSLMAGANSDLVTVITPTRDRSQLLRRVLKYFREQDYKNIEWQILDDSSSPADWVNDVSDGNIFYERVDKQMTLGEKRNYLVDKARGDIIVQFDDDDYYAPNYVSSMVSTLWDRGADLINLRGWFLYDVRSHFFGYWDLMQKHGLHYRCDPAGVSLRILEQNDRDWTTNHMGFGFSYVFKKRIHKQVKFPHINWNEDTTFYLNAASSFKTDGVHDTKGICLHVLHEASTSRCFPQYHFPQFIFDELFPNLKYLCKSKPDESKSKSGDNTKAVYPENKQEDSPPIGLNSSAVRAVPNHEAATVGMTEVDERGKAETTVLGTAPAGRAPEATVIEKDRAEQMPIRAKTIGLCMIVKNETKVIRQCLESTLPLIDYILVVDTGSTDGTQEVIRDFLAHHNIKGTVIDEPWHDFAYNRSFALARLREVAEIDYALVIDADDTLELDAGFEPVNFKTLMLHDLYDVQIRHGNITHYRAQLFSTRLPFSFKGVLHEYLQAPEGNISRATAEGFAIRASSGGGFRSTNPRKYQDDAAVLERALATETDPFLISRYTFYLAQSYKDCGEKEKAATNYLKRADLGFWNEEIYVSLLEAGNLMAALERPFEEVIAAWERATQAVPTRAEALHAASRYCRDKGKNAAGLEFARRGIDLVQPSGLFVQPWVYEYGILDEFAVNAYWAGAYRESLDASLKLLASDKLPPPMVKRIVANARFAAQAIPVTNPPNLGSFGAEDLITQHKLEPQRSLHSRVNDNPLVMIAILAKQKEPTLPLYLECIEALDYPKSRIVLYIRTDDDTENTEKILRDWLSRVGHIYYKVEFDANNVRDRADWYGEHEWNAIRFSVLGRIRNESMRRARELECDFYFVADVDNFIRPATLRELIALDLPIVAPLLRSIAPGRFYSNYHAEIDPNGYYQDCDQYLWILNRYIRGIIEVPVVHCTYLVRSDVIPKLTYEDASGRHEYVVFSDGAREAGIPQYLDNRQIYGYITFGENDEQHVSGGVEQARALLSDVEARSRPEHKATRPCLSAALRLYPSD